jgi:hypothetical protein
MLWSISATAQAYAERRQEIHAVCAPCNRRADRTVPLNGASFLLVARLPCADHGGTYSKAGSLFRGLEWLWCVVSGVPVAVGIVVRNATPVSGH